MAYAISRRSVGVALLSVAAFLAGADAVLYLARKKPLVQREAATPFTVDIEAASQRVVDLANSERAAAGPASLMVSDNLKECSRIRAGQMAEVHSIEHTDPTGGLGAQDILDAWGVPYVFWGENTARLSALVENPADAVHRAWMLSDSHRANILFAGFTRIGASAQPGDDGLLYFCTVFSREAED